ncbi:unnamed protein product [Prunus armeniaca]|uniref:Uncharacterized protein n=1 Tax=Prunus armeniaca TaxID=36596 RepID=A0A6J5XW16_PRUAR|nr:unnamed protein product [Prunus armeniaca]
MQCNMGSMEEYEVDTKVDEINLCFDRSIPSADSAQQNEEADSFKTEKKSKGNEIKGKFHRLPRKQKDPKPDTSKTKESSQSHATKDPKLDTAPLNIYDALQMLRKLREALFGRESYPIKNAPCYRDECPKVVSLYADYSRVQPTWAKSRGLYCLANRNRGPIFRRPIPCDQC